MRLLFLSCLIVLVPGCGGDPVVPPDASPDAPGDPACAGLADGTPCGDTNVCAGGVCAASTCGDDVLDTRTEQCDDGNTTAFDGCDPSCTFTCTESAQCDDSNPCNGEETCGDATNACTPGTMLADATACTTADVADGVCGGGMCIPAGCGNGVVEPSETCDDGDDDPLNGCTDACVFTCTTDAECQDATVCNGLETCDTTNHVCVPGTMMSCDDGNDCTTDSCDDALGCSAVLMDGDGDGFAPTTIGPCGTDCDDTRSDTRPGAEELCSDARDNNCNGAVDEVAPTWYVDCDNDGYAADTTSSRQSCTEPAASLAGCSPGGWTTIRPVDLATTDCAQTVASRNPGATEIVGDQIDQNCDTRETCYLDADDDNFRRTDGRTITSTDLDCLDADEARSSEPATDCCDTDNRARPGQTAYFTSARTTCGGFDYNCDNVSTREITAVGDCNSSCSTITGWNGSAPACGVLGGYWGSGSTCTPIGFGGGCIEMAGLRTQACR